MTSKAAPIEIFFLSFDEPLAEQNWQSLAQRFPEAKRVHGVRGILRAHRTCAEISESRHFFVVDGDNEILPHFRFQFSFSLEPRTCYVWRALNPVNGLAYGFGAVKLLDRELLLEKKAMGMDMTTSLGDRYVIIPEVASVTRFNANPFHAWKSAFREAVKLASQAIARANSAESAERLDIWLTKAHPEAQFSEWSLRGARCGKDFATAKMQNAQELARINDYDWLKSYFQELYGFDPVNRART